MLNGSSDRNVERPTFPRSSLVVGKSTKRITSDKLNSISLSYLLVSDVTINNRNK
jgi:hypothetical protein